MADSFGTTLTSLPSQVMNWFTGGPSTTVTKANVPPLQGQPYPSQDDVAFARDNDASYGSVGAAYTQPPYGGQLPQMRTADQISRSWDSMDDTGNLPIKAAPVAPKVSDNLMAGYLASNRSALAGLGFDPRHMAIGNAEPHDWAMSGSYYPQSDQILTTGTYPSTTAHESMHRGMAMLRDAGMMPPAANDMSEESIVRGQMLRNFGDTEMGRGSVGDDQIASGRYYNENRNFSPTMDAIETAAQKLYAQLHPRGPR